MAIDRRYGRGVKLTLALFLLGCSTPASPSCRAMRSAGGYAIADPGAVCASAQGMALGGSLGRARLAARAERAARSERGWYAMIPQLGAPLGLFVRERAVRLPVDRAHRGGLPRLGLALSVLRRLRDQRRGAVRPAADRRHARVRAACSRAASCSRRRCARRCAAEGGNILIGAFAPLASFALFHMVTVFPLSWVYLLPAPRCRRFLVIEIGTAPSSASRRSSPRARSPTGSGGAGC